MRKKRLLLFIMCLAQMLTQKLSAQSIEPTRERDIVVLEMNTSSTSDTFTLMTLATINEDEIIFITDIGVQRDTSPYTLMPDNGETIIRFTAKEQLPPGTIIRFEASDDKMHLHDTSLGSLSFFEESGSFDDQKNIRFNNEGDQIIIYKTTDNRISNGGEYDFIYAFQTNRFNDRMIDGWYDEDIDLRNSDDEYTGDTQWRNSHRPSYLNAVPRNATEDQRISGSAFAVRWVKDIGPQYNSYRYDGSIEAAKRSVWLNRVNNADNWKHATSSLAIETLIGDDTKRLAVTNRIKDLIPDLQIDNFEQEGCGFTIKWTSPEEYYDDNFQYVRIYRDGSTLLDVKASEGTYTDTDGIIAGKEYEYQIRNIVKNIKGQVNADDDKDDDYIFKGGKIDRSSPETGTIDLLEAPSGLAIEQTECDGSIDLTWSYGTNPGAFVIERKLKGEESFTVVNDLIPASKREFNDNNNIEEGVNYIYRIAAISDEESCATKGEVSFEEEFFNGDVDFSELFGTEEKYSLEVSKGYFPSHTGLEWAPNLAFESHINQYRVYIREFGTTATPNLLKTLDVNERTFDDTKGKAGVLYEYFVVGERVTEDPICGRKIRASFNINKLEGFKTSEISNLIGLAYDVGFRVATGIINGNITYEGGIAVSNIKVIAERESGIEGKSLSFDGQNNYAIVEHDHQLVPASGSITVSAWVKPTKLSINQTILEKTGAYRLNINSDKTVSFAITDQDGTTHTVTSNIENLFLP